MGRKRENILVYRMSPILKLTVGVRKKEVMAVAMVRAGSSAWGGGAIGCEEWSDSRYIPQGQRGALGRERRRQAGLPGCTAAGGEAAAETGSPGGTGGGKSESCLDAGHLLPHSGLGQVRSSSLESEKHGLQIADVKGVRSASSRELAAALPGPLL